MPAPDFKLSQAVAIYLQNRTSMYEIMFSRLPQAILVARLKTDVEPLAPDPALLEAVRNIGEQANDELLSALQLRDLLKKPGHGSALARTTISVDEALARVQQVEETGVLLFTSLVASPSVPQAELFMAELARRKHALANLIRLEDELRYHRLRLTPTR